MKHILRHQKAKLNILLLLVGILLLFIILSLAVGQHFISVSSVYQAVFNYDQQSTRHLIIRSSRLSRTVIALAAGGSLAVAGALMQALTANPLAAPGIFGLNSGAVFLLVIAAAFFGINSMNISIWLAFAGSMMAGLLVYFISSLGRSGLSSLKMILSGAAVTALFHSFTQGILVINQESLESVLFWLSGSTAGRDLEMIMPLLPFILGAVILALILARDINILLIGEEMAAGLGQKTIVIKLLLGLSIVILAGSSVAAAGAISFIGLIVPHIGRFFVGNNYHWLIIYSFILGAMLLLLADIIARIVIMPQEVPIGVMTAFMGAPFFVYIVRRGFKVND
ncbi:iron complex transport system permease protein [Halanaerobium saccharolyticum]|uniref:Iron complex transport system permease protein n=1 Tax=Halanaerobium saccharolyticum TaxID=43595 RepID=A0A4R7YWY5_9FIRM|nr:iron ABC transporter permease [Halanaerobium saccharolyticum]RAK06350.1 iron complex transport system permease protein [Halanaerobium saccharolyticum]TDW00662.1 iron complex transport system permease protein [Halanaerobium saccharolyticum]TDX52275.1 iron complex transport system permease protein [Halanaerobium saccharolyticum]